MTITPPRLLVRLLARGCSLLSRSLRLVGVVEDLPVSHPRDYPFGPEIFAFSERDVFGLVGILGEARFTVLVARGRDGDWATAAVEELGGTVVRGAFRRGGAGAFSALRRALVSGAGPAGLVIDGPVGPEGVAREGAVACAATTGRALRPVAAAARRAIVFRKAWSRIWVPLPFTRVVVACGAPMPVPEGAGREERRLLTEELSRRIAAERARAVALVARRASGPGDVAAAPA